MIRDFGRKGMRGVARSGERHLLGPDKDAAKMRFHEPMSNPNRNVRTDNDVADPIIELLRDWQFPIDQPRSASENDRMSTDTTTSGRHDLDKAIARLMTGRRDPEAGKKAREDMDRMREETRKRVGTVDVAVEFIRDARDQ